MAKTEDEELSAASLAKDAAIETAIAMCDAVIYAATAARNVQIQDASDRYDRLVDYLKHNKNGD